VNLVNSRCAIEFIGKPPHISKMVNPTPITVHAQDGHTNRVVDGRVIIDDQQVGITNTPFTYTFNTTSHSVCGQIIAHGYPDTKVLFSLAFPNPQVRADLTRYLLLLLFLSMTTS